MTLLSRPIVPPEPPVRGGYTEEVERRFGDAIDNALANGDGLHVGPLSLLDELGPQNLRLLDTTRERAAVDERVYSQALNDRDWWKARHGELLAWTRTVLGSEPTVEMDAADVTVTRSLTRQTL